MAVHTHLTRHPTRFLRDRIVLVRSDLGSHFLGLLGGGLTRPHMPLVHGHVYSIECVHVTCEGVRLAGLGFDFSRPMCNGKGFEFVGIVGATFDIARRDAIAHGPQNCVGVTLVPLPYVVGAEGRDDLRGPRSCATKLVGQLLRIGLCLCIPRTSVGTLLWGALRPP